MKRLWAKAAAAKAIDRSVQAQSPLPTCSRSGMWSVLHRYHCKVTSGHLQPMPVLHHFQCNSASRGSPTTRRIMQWWSAPFQCLAGPCGMVKCALQCCHVYVNPNLAYTECRATRPRKGNDK